MKIKQLTQSIAALTMISSGAAFGFAYENYSHLNTPDVSVNSLNWINAVCGPNCTGTSGELSKSSAVLRLDLTQGTVVGDEIQLSGTSAAGGGTDTGADWVVNMTHFDFAAPGTVFDVLATSQIPGSGVELGIWAWDITTTLDGRLKTWLIKSVTIVGPDDFVTCHTNGGGTGNGSSGSSIAYSGNAAAVDCATINPAALPAGVALDSENDDYHATCDITGECGQLNKSVPVPAFAAAALGLGLVGITYLTARRKKIA